MSYYRDINLGVDKNSPNITLNINAGGSGNTYCKIISKTVEQWAALPSFIPSNQSIIVYSNYYLKEDGTFSPRIKLGDGTAYVVDLPWADGYLVEQMQNALDKVDTFEYHIQNANVHISSEDRTFWNNKINCAIDEPNERLILNRN